MALCNKLLSTTDKAVNNNETSFLFFSFVKIRHTGI